MADMASSESKVNGSTGLSAKELINFCTLIVAVSLQIQNLERQLNIPIFYQDKRQARLTEAGQLLLKYNNIFKLSYSF